LNILVVISLSFNKETAQVEADSVDDDAASLQIVKVVPFNNVAPTSVEVDTLRNLVYVSVSPGYPYNYTLSLCEENATNQLAIANALYACSAIYVLDGDSGLINNIIHLGPGEQIKDIDIDTEKRMLYASGEYNYLDVDSHSNEVIHFEDDVVYIIDSNNGSFTQASDAISRITLYGEIEEGKAHLH
jgi:hypothetical protein